MSYQVLARKYRPRSFDDVVGQEHAVRALVNALDKDRLHHAYLFTGTRGTGKTTIARILANCLNCEQGVSSSPCGECDSCTEIIEGRFIDLIEVDAASRTGVDDTRDLLNNAQYLPTRGRFKVYLIDEVHMLSTPSFNALLKTLEEPPPHVKFLLATTNPQKIPMTVLSRCLQFNLKNILPDVITEHLRSVLTQESFESDDVSLNVIARAADGSLRDALSIADQAVSYCGGSLEGDRVAEMLGTVRADEVTRLLDALADRDRIALFKCTNELASRAAELADVLDNLQRAFHELAMAYATDTKPEGDLQNYSDRFSSQWIQLAYQTCLMGGRDMQYAPDPKVGFEMTLIRLLDFEPAYEGVDTTPSGSGGNGSVAVKEDRGAQEQPSKKQRKTKVTDTKAMDSVPKAGGQAPLSGAPWHERIEEIPATGVTAMILEHSNLIALTEDRIELLLDENHDTLYNDTQQGHLEEIFAERIGNPVEVVVTTGTVVEETPAVRKQRLAQERLDLAESALRKDENVRSLMSEFDGRLDAVQPRSD